MHNKDFGGKMTISVARTMFIVNIEFLKNQNPNLKYNSSSTYKPGQLTHGQSRI